MVFKRLSQIGEVLRYGRLRIKVFKDKIHFACNTLKMYEIRGRVGGPQQSEYLKATVQNVLKFLLLDSIHFTSNITSP